MLQEKACASFNTPGVAASFGSEDEKTWDFEVMKLPNKSASIFTYLAVHVKFHMN